MKIGQLIRKKSKRSYLVPIGSYMIIESFPNNDCVMTTNGHLIPRKLVYEVKIAKFNIPDEVLKRILNGQQTAIIHDLSTKWEKLLHEETDVIQLRSVKYAKIVGLFEIESVSTVYYKCTPQVRVQLGQRLLFDL